MRIFTTFGKLFLTLRFFVKVSKFWFKYLINEMAREESGRMVRRFGTCAADDARIFIGIKMLNFRIIGEYQSNCFWFVVIVN